MEIYTQDNFVEQSHIFKILSYLNNSAYKWGEYDTDPNKPTGLVKNILEHEFWYKLFDDASRKHFPVLEGYNLIRMYVNKYYPNEPGYWHQDLQDPTTPAYTVLYYPNLQWTRDDGGCTEFWAEDHTYGSFPVPNRAICFDGKIFHRSTPFTDSIRHSVALKYEKDGTEN